jgi:hypothetical protein
MSVKLFLITSRYTLRFSYDYFNPLTTATIELLLGLKEWPQNYDSQKDEQLTKGTVSIEVCYVERFPVYKFLASYVIYQIRIYNNTNGATSGNF